MPQTQLRHVNMLSITPTGLTLGEGSFMVTESPPQQQDIDRKINELQGCTVIKDCLKKTQTGRPTNPCQ